MVSKIICINVDMTLSKSVKQHWEYCIFGSHLHMKGVKVYLGAMRFLI